MIEQAIKTLDALTEARVKSQMQAAFIDKPNLPPGAYAVRTKDGDIEIRHSDNRPRHHVAMSLDSLLDYVARWAKGAPSGAAPTTVWHNEDTIIALLNDSNEETGRGHEAVMNLPVAEEWQWLTAQKSYHLKQEEFLRLIRTTLLDRVFDPTLKTAIGQVKWRRASTADSNVSLGRASLDRNIEAEVAGVGNIPEFFTVQTILYGASPDEQTWPTWNVRVLIEPDLVGEKFWLIPVQLDIEKARDAALSAMNELIVAMLDKRGMAEGQVPVYAGQP